MLRITDLSVLRPISFFCSLQLALIKKLCTKLPKNLNVPQLLALQFHHSINFQCHAEFGWQENAENLRTIVNFNVINSNLSEFNRTKLRAEI